VEKRTVEKAEGGIVEFIVSMLYAKSIENVL